jgi:hypothetical protein
MSGAHIGGVKGGGPRRPSVPPSTGTSQLTGLNLLSVVAPSRTLSEKGPDLLGESRPKSQWVL